MEASPSKRKKIMMNETTKSPEETKVGRNKRKKTIIKEKTPSLLAELGAMPVEVLVKIFNFLPNHDIRCGVSLVCNRFLEICQNKSLVPVKDLCIYGQPFIWESNIKYQVATIIRESKKLSSLKIKTLNTVEDPVNDLVKIAFQECPKLSHLEIRETYRKQKDLKPNYGLMDIIKKHGKILNSINLLIANQTGKPTIDFQRNYIKYISLGCSKLKSLTLESDMWGLQINRLCLEELCNGCKELKDLKLCKILFNDIFAKDEIEKIFPSCNVEIKDCHYDRMNEDDPDWTIDGDW